jgi:hypothetical protein
MADADDKAGLTVRVIVKLRPDEYDELFRHVRRIGSTMSAFLQESAARAIEEERPFTLDQTLSPEILTAPE